MVKKLVRTRGYCGTINNPTDKDLSDIIIYGNEADYFIGGFEKGDKGTDHIQFFIYFINKREFSSIKEMFPRSHIEAKRGTKLDALIYCMKDLDYFEFGKRPKQGKRSDLDVIHLELKSGKKTSDDIAEEYFAKWCQYHRSFEKYEQIKNKSRKYNTQIIAYDSQNLDYCMDIIYDKYSSFTDNPEDYSKDNLVYYDTTEIHFHLPRFFAIYKSGRYKTILVPCNNGTIPKQISKNIIEVICPENAVERSLRDLDLLEELGDDTENE